MFETDNSINVKLFSIIAINIVVQVYLVYYILAQSRVNLNQFDTDWGNYSMHIKEMESFSTEIEENLEIE